MGVILNLILVLNNDIYKKCHYFFEKQGKKSTILNFIVNTQKCLKHMFPNEKEPLNTLNFMHKYKNCVLGTF